MNTMNFTKAYYNLDSSLIDFAFYNENDSEVFLAIGDNFYRYSEVSPYGLSELLKAESIGAFYNRNFKHEYGAAEKLPGLTNFVRVPVIKNNSTPATPKGLTDSRFDGAYATTNNSLLSVLADGDVSKQTTPVETKEFSLNVFDHSVSGSPISTQEPTKEFSLRFAEPASEKTVSRIRLHFVLNGLEGKKYKFDAASEDLYEAIEELSAHVSNLGKTGRVTKAVVKFD